MRRVAALLLCTVIAGCASVDAGPQKAAGITTIGIVSSVGDQLTLTKAGLTAMQDNEQSFPIQSWGIDDLIVGRASALLSKRYQVVAVNYQRAAFANLHESSPITGVDLLRSDPIKELVRTEITPQGLDAYLVITKATSSFGSRRSKVAGLGIVSRQTLSDSSIRVHALYRIRLVNGHGFEVKDNRQAQPFGANEIGRLAGPSQSVDDSFLPGPDGVAANQKLKGAITGLIEASLPATLKSMGLVDEP
jgi:hypothetical protein